MINRKIFCKLGRRPVSVLEGHFGLSLSLETERFGLNARILISTSANRGQNFDIGRSRNQYYWSRCQGFVLCLHFYFENLNQVGTFSWRRTRCTVAAAPGDGTRHPQLLPVLV